MRLRKASYSSSSLVSSAGRSIPKPAPSRAVVPLWETGNGTAPTASSHGNSHGNCTPGAHHKSPGLGLVLCPKSSGLGLVFISQNPRIWIDFMSQISRVWFNFPNSQGWDWLYFPNSRGWERFYFPIFQVLGLVPFPKFLGFGGGWKQRLVPIPRVWMESGIGSMSQILRVWGIQNLGLRQFLHQLHPQIQEKILSKNQEFFPGLNFPRSGEESLIPAGNSPWSCNS